MGPCMKNIMEGEGWLQSATQPLLVLSCNAPPHKQLLRTEPHSFPAVNQLESSFLFLEGVCTTFAGQLCLYWCPMCE